MSAHRHVVRRTVAVQVPHLIAFARSWRARDSTPAITRRDRDPTRLRFALPKP